MEGRRYMRSKKIVSCLLSLMLSASPVIAAVSANDEAGKTDYLELSVTDKAFTVTPYGRHEGSGIVSVALYDSEEQNRLLETVSFDLSEDKTPEGTFTANGRVVKAFWWKSLETLAPFCKPESRIKEKVTDTLPQTSGEYYLANDLTIAEAWTIPYEADIRLDLNGHTIRRELTGATTNGYVIGVSGKLMLYDGTEEKKGTVTGGKNSGAGGGIYAGRSSSVTLKNITVSGNSANTGGGLYIEEYATVEATDCHIDGNNASGAAGIFNKGTLNVTGGSLSQNHATNNSGGFYANMGTADFRTCTIEKNRSDNYGGAFFIDDTAVVRLYESTVSDNSAKNGGGAFEMEKNGSTLFINDTKVTDNRVDQVVEGTHKGGGIHFYKGTVIMGGVMIVEGNTCAGDASNICLRGNPVILSGGKVTATSRVFVNDDILAIITGIGTSNVAGLVMENGNIIVVQDDGSLVSYPKK